MALLSSGNVKTFHKSVPIDMEILGVLAASNYAGLSPVNSSYLEMFVNNRNIFNKPIPFVHLNKGSNYLGNVAEVKKGSSIEITVINTSSYIQVVVLGKTKNGSLYCLVFE